MKKRRLLVISGYQVKTIELRTVNRHIRHHRLQSVFPKRFIVFGRGFQSQGFRTQRREFRRHGRYCDGFVKADVAAESAPGAEPREGIERFIVIRHFPQCPRGARHGAEFAAAAAVGVDRGTIEKDGKIRPELFRKLRQNFQKPQAFRQYLGRRCIREGIAEVAFFKRMYCRRSRCSLGLLDEPGEETTSVGHGFRGTHGNGDIDDNAGLFEHRFPVGKRPGEIRFSGMSGAVRTIAADDFERPLFRLREKEQPSGVQRLQTRHFDGAFGKARRFAAADDDRSVGRKIGGRSQGFLWADGRTRSALGAAVFADHGLCFRKFHGVCGAYVGTALALSGSVPKMHAGRGINRALNRRHDLSQRLEYRRSGVFTALSGLRDERRAGDGVPAGENLRAARLMTVVHRDESLVVIDDAECPEGFVGASRKTEGADYAVSGNRGQDKTRYSGI